MNMSQTKPLWLNWILLNFLVGSIGWFAIALAAWLTFGMALVGLGTVLGISHGWVQGKLLKSYTQVGHSSRWVKHSIIAATIVWVTIMIVSISIQLASPWPRDILLAPLIQVLLVTMGGGIFGFIQWSWTLSKSGAVWWAIACAVGWGSGSALGAFISGMFIPYRTGRIFSPLDAVSVFIIGVVATAIFSIVTGFVLPNISSRLRGHLT